MMSADPQQEIFHRTPDGDLRIRSFCTPAQIRTLNFDNQFGTYAQYKSLYTKRESLEKNAAEADANVALAIHDADIVGFGVLNYPSEDERWARVGPRAMMEVKALEVSRSWRSGGIAGKILRMLLTHPRLEEMIVYMVGYSWTWDLDGTGKTAQQYRQTMIRLFEPYGFQEYETNEPNICLKPENLFMGRVGERVAHDLLTRFKWLRFDIEP